MDRKPEVTVLLPVYNAGPFLRESIDSVLAQTFTNFELLIINDGSSDNSAEIISSYNDDRIKVIHQENMGLVKTLNKGIDIASGDLIARFDADDVCYPRRLQEQVDFLRAHPDYVLVGSEADYMDEEGNYIFTYRFGFYTDEEIRNMGFVFCPTIHSAATYRKWAVIAAGKYDERAITFEDHMLWRKLADFGKMENIRKPLIKVRFNAASVTIDEKWRGKEFIELKQRSIEAEQVNDEDFTTLNHILRTQNFKEYKEAAYYSMLGKKFLWDQHKPAQARQYFTRAIVAMPKKAEPYLLYALSLLPKSFITMLYKQVKKKKGR